VRVQRRLFCHCYGRGGAEKTVSFTPLSYQRGLNSASKTLSFTIRGQSRERCRGCIAAFENALSRVASLLDKFADIGGVEQKTKSPSLIISNIGTCHSGWGTLAGGLPRQVGRGYRPHVSVWSCRRPIAVHLTKKTGRPVSVNRDDGAWPNP